MTIDPESAIAALTGRTIVSIGTAKIAVIATVVAKAGIEAVETGITVIQTKVGGIAITVVEIMKIDIIGARTIHPASLDTDMTSIAAVEVIVLKKRCSS